MDWLTSHGINAQVVTEQDGSEIGLSATIPNNSWVDVAIIHVLIFLGQDGRVLRADVHRIVAP